MSNVLSSLTPGLDKRLSVLEHFAPQAVPPAARTLIVPVGLALVLIARDLARRNRQAWQLAVALLALSAGLNLARGLEFEAAAMTAVLAFALVAYRNEFSTPGDPSVRRNLLIRVAFFGAAIYGYGLLALFANRALADRPFSAASAVDWEKAHALAAMELGQAVGTWGGKTRAVATGCAL